MQNATYKFKKYECSSGISISTCILFMTKDIIWILIETKAIQYCKILLLMQLHAVQNNIGNIYCISFCIYRYIFLMYPKVDLCTIYIISASISVI